MKKGNIKQHLINRNVDLSLHNVFIDEDLGVAIFPFYNLVGSMFGYQQYKPDGDKKCRKCPKSGKYFTYCTKGNQPYWGIESITTSKTLFLTEGIFDACRITKKGFSALALLTNDPKRLKPFLKCLGSNRRIVAVCDGDKAGKRLAKYGNENHIMPEEFDLGDAPNEYVETLLETYK